MPSFFALKCDGIWLQIALAAACEARQLGPLDYAKSVVGLAQHGHDHISLSGVLLYWIARQDQHGFPGLKIAMRFLAGPNAEMQSHHAVFHDFMSLIWPPSNDFPKPKVEAVTGLGLNAMLEHRKYDWGSTLIEIITWERGRRYRGLSRYIADWIEVVSSRRKI